ncbi:MAG: SAM-dependent methyltransferase [Bacteroidetes bacterium]|nr:MAG: SAM-dependent methyltransferase [Bacteroidota bacterium]RLD51293.1 MAG: SAM-dependent methyltransferase [Bacteroidota bacterium]RLD81696.1 MAG: SAM-dependent methyltransferase [Bacteroidota bacterium]
MITRKIRSVIPFLKYRFGARSMFKVHSPFVYEFYTEVILDKNSRSTYDAIEKQRRSLLRQRSLLETTDFGTGSGKNEYKVRFRQVKNVTRHSSISPKCGKLIHRLVEFNKPDDVLEIGTAMGISSLYIATAAPKSNFVTMEGCAMIAEKAMENFNSFGINNIELAMGNFDLLLEKTLIKFDKLDFVLVDGNHRREPTIEYFRLILPKLHEGSMVIIDDIHWSKGMEQAWNEIRANEKVSVSIDLFRTGILLFKKDIAKENFILKF